MKKYTDLFNQYDSVKITAEKAKQEVGKIINKNFAENNNAGTYKKIFGFLDFTSLNNTDNEESIRKFVEKANNFKLSVAGICVYPSLVETVKKTLTKPNVEIASVVGFPAPQNFLEVKIAETAMAVLDGATEIDMVFPIGKFLEENYQELCEEISEIKTSCRHAKLKVILETGTLQTPENIAKATLLAIVSGADFIKTSTGKNATGATLEAAYTICRVIKEFENKNNTRIGIKISGGVDTKENAVEYYTIVKEILGNEYLNKDFFRIGASRLAEELM